MVKKRISKHRMIDLEVAKKTLKEHENINIDSLFNIGDRIRILRKNQRRTIQEVANNSKLSKSMISKIENNKTIPSVASLVKIARTLGTNISDLLEENGGGVAAMVTAMKEALKNLVKTEKGYSIFPYASEFHEKKMQPFLFVAKKGEVVPHRLSHEGEEFIFVVEGKMRMKVAEIEYILKKGDSLYFNSLQKHGVMPVSEKVVYLDIFV